jgi:PAS domain S-box-containing protein
LFQDGHVIFANKAVSEVSGYSLEELQSLHLNELMSIIHPEDQEHVFRETEKMLAGNLPNVVQKFRIVRKDGSIRCVNAHLSSVEHENKPTLQVAYHDITNSLDYESQNGM